MKTSSLQVGLIYENFNITILRAGKCGWSTSTHGCRLAAMMQTKKVSAAAVQQCFFFTLRIEFIFWNPKSWRWMDNEFPFQLGDFEVNRPIISQGVNEKEALQMPQPTRIDGFSAHSPARIWGISVTSHIKTRTLQRVWVNCSSRPKHLYLDRFPRGMMGSSQQGRNEPRLELCTSQITRTPIAWHQSAMTGTCAEAQSGSVGQVEVRNFDSSAISSCEGWPIHSGIWWWKNGEKNDNICWQSIPIPDNNVCVSICQDGPKFVRWKAIESTVADSSHFLLDFFWWPVSLLFRTVMS